MKTAAAACPASYCRCAVERHGPSSRHHQAIHRSPAALSPPTPHLSGFHACRRRPLTVSQAQADRRALHPHAFWVRGQPRADSTCHFPSQVCLLEFAWAYVTCLNEFETFGRLHYWWVLLAVAAARVAVVRADAAAVTRVPLRRPLRCALPETLSVAAWLRAPVFCATVLIFDLQRASYDAAPLTALANDLRRSKPPNALHTTYISAQKLEACYLVE